MCSSLLNEAIKGMMMAVWDKIQERSMGTKIKNGPGDKDQEQAGDSEGGTERVAMTADPALQA